MCGAHFNTYTEAEAIAAWNTRAYLNPDGLPMGLTISDNGNLLNWRGENYVKQGMLGEQPAKSGADALSRRARDMARNIQGNLGRCLYRRKDVAEMEEVSETLMELADELNAELGSGTCTMSIGKSRIGDDEIESFVCSICGYEMFRQYTFGNDGEFVSYPEPNYCPHCGALRSWANEN